MLGRFCLYHADVKRENTQLDMDGKKNRKNNQPIIFADSGGDMDIVVASDKEIKVGAVREAFQFMFGKATVRSVDDLVFSILNLFPCCMQTDL